jgi:hypothetical protein
VTPTLDSSQTAQAGAPARHPGLTRKLGRLAITVAGGDAIASHFTSEIDPLPAPNGTEPGSMSILYEKPARIHGEVRVGPYFIAPDRIRVEDPLLSVTFNPVFDQVTLASKADEWPRRTDGVLTRLRDMGYLPALDRAAKGFLYDYFNQVVQLRQLSLGQTWIHSSAVTKASRTAALMAWGGSGKTSAMLELVRHHGWSFLADDLTVMDESGCISRSPQRLQLSALNIQGDEALRKRVLARRDPLDRFQWYARKRLRGPGRVRRRMHAFEVFGGDAVADEGQLTDAFFLRRVDRARFESTDISADHTAALCAQVLHAELDPLCELQTAVHSSDVAVEFPGMEETHAEAQRILAAAFSSPGVRCRLVDVPFGAAPRDLGVFFSRLLAA